MATARDFDEHIGKIMRICQGIEHDIKLIYCGMREDANDENFDIVFKSISKTTLGAIINRLYKIDHSYMQPYFSESDYQILKEITNIRNYWAHQGYIDWMYNNSEYSFQHKWEQLIRDYNRIYPLGQQTERIRLKFFGLNTEDD